MDNDLDFRDLLLEVEAEATLLMEEITKELQLPMMKQALRVRWMTLSDDMKEQVREEYPEVYQQIMRTVNAERKY
jgi:hypothetical protein